MFFKSIFLKQKKKISLGYLDNLYVINGNYQILFDESLFRYP